MENISQKIKEKKSNEVKITELDIHFGTKAIYRPPQLPYSYNALEPIIDAKTLKTHYLNYHMRSFEDLLDKLNNTLTEEMSSEEIFRKINQFDNEMVVFAGSCYNHQLYWDNLSPYGGNMSQEFEEAISKSFGSVHKFKNEFIKVASSHICCGWVWLILDVNHQLKLTTTNSYYNPLMVDQQVQGYPLLTIDLWEHAFFQKYQYNKEDYLKSIWMIINWNEVSNRYMTSL